MVTIFKMMMRERIRELWARLQTARNRRRHADLNKKYREANDAATRSSIADEMMERDRKAQRSSSSNRADPILWDYFIPPGRIGWKMASSAALQREANRRELLQRGGPGRR
jgi:hypothetical protein